MATLPPAIDVAGKDSPEKLRQWVNAYQKGLWECCQNIDNMAIFLHAAMIAALRAEGLDESGRLGGSTANKAASSVSSKMRRASRNLEAAIKLLKGAQMCAQKNVDGPIQTARAARSRTTSTYSV